MAVTRAPLAAAAWLPLQLGRLAAWRDWRGAAVACYGAALWCAPRLALALEKRGALHRRCGRFDAAARDLQDAAAQGSRAAPLFQLGLLRVEQGCFDAALACFDAALARQPQHAGLRLNRALAELTGGDLARGWQQYHDCLVAREGRHGFHAAVPRWDGRAALTGQRVLVYCRQGSGDVLQFVRFLRPLAARGARVTVLVQPALHALLAAQAFGPAVQFVTAADAGHAFRCDLMSLPHLLGHDSGAAAPYLRAATPAQAHWAATLGPRRRPRVGLAWSGDPAHHNDHNRSLALRDWLPHLPGGVDYICLQDRVRPADLAALRASALPVRLPGAALRNFDDTAALCSQMDLVVSVDTSVAHLAGALGVPLALLLPFVPDFRWRLGRSDSPWYPGATLHRQQRAGDWSAPLAAISTTIARLAARPLP
jgi:hypothetical protein